MEDTAANLHEKEEEFTFVSRKKNGRRQKKSASASIAATIVNPPIVPTTSLKTSEEQKETNLPGWGLNRKPGKVKKNSQRAKMMGSIGVDQEERTLEWGQCLIDERILTLKQSKFYQAFRELAQATLCEPCKKLQKPTATQQQSATTLEDSLGEEIGDLKTQEDKPVSDTPIPVGEQLGIEIVDMICYGIGSIESSRNAQFQLAMAICLKEVLQLSGTLSIFDPIMTSYDNKLVEHYGFKVLTGDGRSRQPVKVKTLYFMPHCPKGLYSLVLETNWSRECLDNTVILGNRFTMYDESLSFKQLVNQAPFILPALSISQISLLPAIKFEDNTAFNDLGFHCFPPDQALPEIDLTDREVDPELL